MDLVGSRSGSRCPFADSRIDRAALAARDRIDRSRGGDWNRGRRRIIRVRLSAGDDRHAGCRGIVSSEGASSASPGMPGRSMFARSGSMSPASNVLISLFQAVRAPLIVVIAGAYVDSRHLAFYGAAQRLANVMSLGLLGISAFASPLISRILCACGFRQAATARPRGCARRARRCIGDRVADGCLRRPAAATVRRRVRDRLRAAADPPVR